MDCLTEWASAMAPESPVWLFILKSNAGKHIQGDGLSTESGSDYLHPYVFIALLSWFLNGSDSRSPYVSLARLV